MSYITQSKPTNTRILRHPAQKSKIKQVSSQRIILFNKPFHVITQFSESNGKKTLRDYIPFSDVYPAGRLDYDSEGLLILTNNGKLQAQLTQPNKKTAKTYLVQVEGIPAEKDLQRLRNGVYLKDGLTLPAQVEVIEEPKWLWLRHPPIRYRLTIPTCWLKLTIYEGRNRQVRRMTAHIGYPTLRLIRYSIGDWRVLPLQPGEWREIDEI